MCGGLDETVTLETLPDGGVFPDGRSISIKHEFKRLAFVMVKPDAVKHLGAIIERFAVEGFTIRYISTVHLDRRKCGLLYKEHIGKPHYERHRLFITGKPCVAMTIESSQYQNDTWAKVKEICGATDPSKAHPDSIRGMYGSGLPENAIHSSDSEELSYLEASIVFDLPGAHGLL